MRRVIYPGLESHPQHALAQAQMRAFGGMITAVLRPTSPVRGASSNARELFALAESLGGVESLIEHPALMTHGSVPADVARRTRHLGLAGPALGRASRMPTI